MMRVFLTILLLAPSLTCLPYALDPLRFDTNRTEAAHGVAPETPTVDFCEMVKRPRLYIDRTVRTTATYMMGYEAAYLGDDRCLLRPHDKFGIRFVIRDEAERAAARRGVDEIASGKYGNGRALVTIVGTLRDAPDRGFGGYRYRFDLISFESFASEDISNAVVAYDGTLTEGKTYRATVRGDKDFDLSLVPALRIAIHHAARVEWINLEEFPRLRRLRNGSGVREIIFTVVSDEIVQMTERRWNRTLRCKIITAE